MKQFKFAPSGAFLAIGGIILFSSKAVFVKLAYQHDVSTLHLLLFRLLFAAPVYMTILLYKRNSIVVSKNDYFPIIMLGFVGYYLASYFDFEGLNYIKARLERIILFLYPTLVLLISKFFIKKEISKTQWLAIGITYIGVLITFWSELKVSGDHIVFGGVLIFLSALTYAVYLVGSGNLIPRIGVIGFTSYAMIVSTICILFHYLISDRGNIYAYDSEVYFYGLVMAIFCTIIPSFLVSAAIKQLGASTFAIFGSLGPVCTIALANILLEESLTLIQVIGCCIVIAGVYVIGKKK